MSNRQTFFNKLFRHPIRQGLHPAIRDISVDKDGKFIDALSNEPVGDPLLLDAKHLHNKIVLVNFFTLRTEAKTQKMAQVARLVKQLGDRVGRDFFIHSVTNDPEHDTPQRLSVLAKELGAPDGWTFVRAMGSANEHISSDMNRVRGYSSGREIFYGIPGGFWGTFPADNSVEATAQRLIDSLPGPKPAQLRKAGPAVRDQEKYSWSARSV